MDDLPTAAMTTKPSCWAYEQEVRMIKQKGNVAADVPTDAIKEIVFGAKMRPDRVQQIIDAVRKAGIDAEFAQMHALPNGYCVRPQRIEC